MGVVTRIKSTGDLLTDGIGYDFPEEIRGVRNLLLNSAFKFNLSSWSNLGSVTIREVITESNGSNWLHIVDSDTTPFEGISQKIKNATANKEYTFSLKAKGTGTACIGLHFLGASNNIISQQWVTMTCTSSEQLLSMTKTTPTGTVAINVIIGSNSLTSFDIYITNIKAEIGNKATDWTPAPEDLGLSYPSTIQEFRKTELYEFPETLRGGRNIIPSNTLVTGSGTTQQLTLSNWATTLISNTGVKNIFVAGETYTISYDMELTQRTSVPTFYAYQAGLYLYSAATTNDVVFYVTTLKNVGDKAHIEMTFVCPPITDQVILYYTNRYTTNGAYPFGYDTISVTNLKIEKVSKATPWTPAPEDLALTYPSWLQNFTESFSDKAIVCGELVEDSTKVNPISLKQGNISIKGAYQEGVTL